MTILVFQKGRASARYFPLYWVPWDALNAVVSYYNYHTIYISYNIQILFYSSSLPRMDNNNDSCLLSCNRHVAIFPLHYTVYSHAREMHITRFRNDFRTPVI